MTSITRCCSAVPRPTDDGSDKAEAARRSATGATASADIAESVRTGGSLSAALRRTGLFPPLLVYLAASGEARVVYSDDFYLVFDLGAPPAGAAAPGR